VLRRRSKRQRLLLRAGLSLSPLGLRPKHILQHDVVIGCRDSILARTEEIVARIGMSTGMAKEDRATPAISRDSLQHWHRPIVGMHERGERIGIALVCAAIELDRAAHVFEPLLRAIATHIVKSAPPTHGADH